MPIHIQSGTPDDCRLDLSDAEAVVLCLSCGGRYARIVARCATCGGEQLVARDRLVAAVSRNAPDLPERTLGRLRLVRIFTVDDPDTLAALRRGLAAAGYPFLAVSHDGALIEAGLPEGPAAFFVPEDDELAIRERVPTWLPVDAERVEGAPDTSVALSALADPQLLAVSHGEFEAQLIGAELNGAGIAFASVPGARGLEFFVPSVDLGRANELLDELEGASREDRRIPEQDLERLALVETPPDDAGPFAARGRVEDTVGTPRGPSSYDPADTGPPPRARRLGRGVRRILLGAMALGCACVALASPSLGAQAIIAWVATLAAAVVLILDLVNPAPA